MAGYTCQFCGMVMAIDNSTHRVTFTTFEIGSFNSPRDLDPAVYQSAVKLDFYKCPNCGEYSVYITGVGEGVKDIVTIVRPKSSAKQYPLYIPQNIRSDYEEACAVLYLSPKSSATLSRRCLQGMIRDFWGIRKARLFDEVSELKDRIPPDLWKSIDGLRLLGNIGAHMEKDTNLVIDIDTDEASNLIKLIEILMKEWYINREERKNVFDEIIKANVSKQVKKEKTE